MNYTTDSLNRSSRTGFSLVMRAFSGKYSGIERAARDAFGRSGLDAFTLAFDRDGSHLPAEIAAGMTKQEAQEVAQVLCAAGAVVDVVATAEVEGVKHHASEVWPTREANGWHFTEVDGMIFTLAPLNARENLRQWREADPTCPNWLIERGMNHQHPTHEYNREALRVAREMGEDLALSLQEAYPQRSFVLDYLEEQMSFYQRGQGASEEDVPPEKPLPDEAYCVCCQDRRPYHLRGKPDAEFPLADWGECATCGEEILLRTWEVRVVVEACSTQQ